MNWLRLYNGLPWFTQYTMGSRLEIGVRKADSWADPMKVRDSPISAAKTRPRRSLVRARGMPPHMHPKATPDAIADPKATRYAAGLGMMKWYCRAIRKKGIIT